jgi:hypothetical protein
MSVRIIESREKGKYSLAKDSIPVDAELKLDRENQYFALLTGDTVKVKLSRRLVNLLEPNPYYF